MNNRHTENALETCADLLAYIDASPSPFHCVDESRRRLEAAGFERLEESDEWSIEAGGSYYLVRGDGSLVAVRAGERPPSESGFRIVGAHTDAPCPRLKPVPAKTASGYLVLDVEVYGGPILATWTDRDLGLAGRLVVENEGVLESRLVRIDEPLCRISNLAIHLDREVNERGLQVDRHAQLPPAAAIWAGGSDPARQVMGLLAEAAGVEAGSIMGHDICLVDVQPAAIGGISKEFVFAGRLDDVAMCHAGLAAILRADPAMESTAVVALFDHEEVGSTTARGASGSLLRDVLTRLAEGHEGEGVVQRALARSMLVSADMAHAVHPNRPERHDGVHMPRLNGGPVIKTNANQRYATDAATAGFFRALCEASEVPVQEFAMRADLPCGSSIGPIASAALGVPTVDVGNPILSMHSIREVGGSFDPEAMTRVLAKFLSNRIA